MERQEIASKLREWKQDGRLASKASLGLSYAEINRRIAREELYQTSYDSIVATDKEVQMQFEELIFNRQILDGNGVRIYKRLLTLYAITMACANGELLRFADFGNKAIIYIV